MLKEFCINDRCTDPSHCYCNGYTEYKHLISTIFMKEKGGERETSISNPVLSTTNDSVRIYLNYMARNQLHTI